MQCNFRKFAHHLDWFGADLGKPASEMVPKIALGILEALSKKAQNIWRVTPVYTALFFSLRTLCPGELLSVHSG